MLSYVPFMGPQTLLTPEWAQSSSLAVLWASPHPCTAHPPLHPWYPRLQGVNPCAHAKCHCFILSHTWALGGRSIGD